MTNILFRELVQADISALVSMGERSVDDEIITDRSGRQHRMRDLLPKPYSDAEIMRRGNESARACREILHSPHAMRQAKFNAVYLISSAREARQLCESEPHRRAFWNWRYWQDFSRACEQTRMALHQHVRRKVEAAESALRG